MNLSVAIAFFVFAFCHHLFAGVEGLECYSCSNCNDPFSVSGVSTTTCSTSCQKIKATSGRVQAVTRGCGTGNKNDCTEETAGGVTGILCTCTGDKCNGAAFNQVPMFISLALATTLVVVVRMF